MSSPPYLKRLKALSEQVPTHNEVMDLLGQLQATDTHASDRAAALVGVSLVEHALKIVIVSYFEKLKPSEEMRLFSVDEKAPLSDLGSRINFAHAMGIIGPLAKSDLMLINKIRNQFAHYPLKLRFNQAEVSDVCKQFKLIKQESNKPLKPKTAYIETIAHISDKLHKGIPKQIVWMSSGGTMIQQPNPSRRHLP